MKLVKAFFAGALASTLSAGIALPFVSSQGTLLRRDLKEGATDSYRFEMKGTQTTPMGEMGLRSTMRYTVKVGALEENGSRAKCELIVSDMKVELDGGVAGMVPPPELPKELVLKGTIDRRNRIAMDTTSLLNPQLAMLGGGFGSPTGIVLEFPEQAVNPGDSWDVTFPKNPFYGNKEPKLRATYVGLKSVEGLGQVFEVSLIGEIPIDVDMQELMKAMPDNAGAQMFGDMKVLVTGKVDMRTTCWIEPTTGRVMRMKTDSETKQNVNLVDMGMSIDTSGTMAITMELERPVGATDKR